MGTETRSIATVRRTLSLTSVGMGQKEAGRPQALVASVTLPREPGA
jgi:hypothetical protein